MGVKIPDKTAQHNPDEMEEQIREWTDTFLRKQLQNIDYDETGRGVDLMPRENDWDDNPLYVRYKDESWFDNPDDRVGRIRSFFIWFPVRDFMEHDQLDVLEEKYTYLIGDEIYEKYNSEIDFRGILLAGSEDSVHNHIKNAYFQDIDVDAHM